MVCLGIEAGNGQLKNSTIVNYDSRVKYTTNLSLYNIGVFSRSLESKLEK